MGRHACTFCAAEGFGSNQTEGNLLCFSPRQLADDRMALVSGISLDPEAAIGVTKRLPPKWVDGADEVSALLWHTQLQFPWRHLLVITCHSHSVSVVAEIVLEERLT